eukprot:GHVR01128442.1.p1 GENE.GHVR01128442.1~~GHVR01128442.1.p1  ORF type:complete len:487 (+),score=43.71 GHVR01128442.1:95-1555(+)
MHTHCKNAHALQNDAQGAQHVVPSDFLRIGRGLPPPACFDYQPKTLADDPLKHTFRCHCTNFFQRHTNCSKNNCLKYKKGTLECKAKFPKQMNHKSSLLRIVTHTTPDSSGVCNRKVQLEFVPQRNDPLVNNYMKGSHYINIKLYKYINIKTYIFIYYSINISLYTGEGLLAWRANMDIKPVISFFALKMYLTKYVTKSEPVSSHLQRILSFMTSGAAAAPAAVQQNERAKLLPSDNALRAYQRLIMGGIKRDWTSQEVLHHIMGLPAYKCDLCFDRITLDTSPCVTVHQGELFQSDNKLIKYYNRCSIAANQSNICTTELHAIRSMCLLEFFQKYYFTNSGTHTKLHMRIKQAVVRTFPRPPAVLMHDNLFAEDFAKCAVLCSLPMQAAACTSPEENVLTLDNGCVLQGDRKWAKRLQVAIDSNDSWVGHYLKMRRVNMDDLGWHAEHDAHTEDAENDNVDNHDMQMGIYGSRHANGVSRWACTR